MAVAARKSGYEVIVLTRVCHHGDLIKSHGFRLLNIKLRRAGINPFVELLCIAEIMMLYIRERPDIVHHVALKPVIYGSIAAFLAGIPNVVNALIGLGYVFMLKGIKGRITRILILRIFKFLLNLNKSILILQNNDDVDLFIKLKIINVDRLRLIYGSGVDINFYYHSSELNIDDGINVLLASRMLESKGIREFVCAARQIRKNGYKINFLLVGGLDDGNPTAIKEAEINAWCKEGVVEWFGYQRDMRPYLLNAHIICLPSYREGLPKVLLEAAASGRAIIATDVPGCREAVVQNVNGLLVPLYDINGLVAAITYLATHPIIRKKMGLAGRNLVVTKFSEAIIQSQITKVYGEFANG